MQRPPLWSQVAKKKKKENSISTYIRHRGWKGEKKQRRPVEKKARPLLPRWWKSGCSRGLKPPEFRMRRRRRPSGLKRASSSSFFFLKRVSCFFARDHREWKERKLVWKFFGRSIHRTLKTLLITTGFSAVFKDHQSVVGTGGKNLIRRIKSVWRKY